MTATMKATRLLIGLCLTFFLIYQSHAQQPENFIVEPNHSTIEFSMPIAGGITRVSGKFTRFLITLNYVEKDLTKSSFRAEISANSVNTGIDRRDRHLKSETFFHTEKYPDIVFESSEITKDGNGYIISGQLTMHGITRPMTIPFEYKGATDRYMAFEAKSSLKRSDFDIGTAYEHPGFPNFLSDKVNFTFSFWATGPVPEEMWDKVKSQIKGN